MPGKGREGCYIKDRERKRGKMLGNEKEDERRRRRVLGKGREEW